MYINRYIGTYVCVVSFQSNTSDVVGRRLVGVVEVVRVPVIAGGKGFHLIGAERQVQDGAQLWSANVVFIKNTNCVAKSFNWNESCQRLGKLFLRKHFYFFQRVILPRQVNLLVSRNSKWNSYFIAFIFSLLSLCMYVSQN
jgi:Na+/proline symporter